MLHRTLIKPCVTLLQEAYISPSLIQVQRVGGLLVSHREFGCVHHTAFPQEVLIFEECSHTGTLRNLSLAPCNALDHWLCMLSLELPTFLACTLRCGLTCG